jgi:hypothetical protein
VSAVSASVWEVEAASDVAHPLMSSCCMHVDTVAVEDSLEVDNLEADSLEVGSSCESGKRHP